MSSEIFGRGSGAKKNERRFPGIKGRRPDRKAARQAEAVARNTAYQLLNSDEKQARNPNKY